MIVVDGRTDEEKLLELLATGAEETSLDFKATLDLSRGSSKDVLEFVKDAISIGNLADGGYIVVGVDDHGRPAHDQPQVVVSQFDSAKLRARIAKYVEAHVQPVSQAHVVDKRDVILVFIPPSPDGLPVPTSAIGQYAKSDGKMETVFAHGEVLVREGTSNVRLRYAHWHGLLGRYREQVKEEARRDSDDLIHRFVQALNEGAGSAGNVSGVPLDLAMDEATLSEALVSSFEAPKTIRVKQFLNSAIERVKAGTAEDRGARLHALDRIAIVACQAVVYDREDIYELAVDALEDAYRSRGMTSDAVRLRGGSDVEIAQHLLDVLLRAFSVGALVVRQRKWSLLPPLADRPVQVSPNYRYASWLRHGSVEAARANLLQGQDGEARGGQLISLARALVADRPALRPDYAADSVLPAADALTHDDWLLNSLCEFDLWWCILAQANGKGTGGGSSFYPSCAALHQYRSQATLDVISTRGDVRRAAFGDIPDEQIAEAVLVVVKAAERESHSFGGFWEGLEANPAVEEFVHKHRN